MIDSEDGKAQGNNACIQEIKNMPLVDAHMHIQSNDIAPIPLMKGIAYYAGLKEPKDKINYYDLSFRDLEPYKFNKNNGLPEADKKNGFPKTEKDNISPRYGLFPTGESFLGKVLLGIAGNYRRSITDTSAGWLASIFVKDYGKVTRHTSFNIAGIYMNELLENSMGIASRREITDGTIIGDPLTYKDGPESINYSRKKRSSLIKSREKTLGKFQNIFSGYIKGERSKIKGSFEFSIILGMELMYAHYWGAYGIPIYIYHNGTLYYVSNELRYIIEKGYNRAEIEVCHNAYDIKGDSLKKNYIVKDKEYNQHTITSFYSGVPASNKEIGTSEKYKHYLVPTKPEEIVQFESFREHCEYIEMAAIKFPFKFLPFYHFDPRRFFGPDIDENIHEFFLTEKSIEKTKLIQVETETIKEDLKKQDPFRYRMDISKLKDELLQKDGEDDTVNNEKGLYWGIKMYAALGYPPYIYNSAEQRKAFPLLGKEENTYKELLDFYKYCADNQIPVTCHGSPQGMTIADPGVYLKEYLKQQEKSKYYKNKKVDFPVGNKQFIQGLGLIDDFSSPSSWRFVLKALNEKAHNFRLCLAHYGGKGFMTGEYTDGSPYCWHTEISELIKNYKQVYTDISNYTIPDINKDSPDLILPESIKIKDYREYKKSFPIVEKIYNIQTEKSGEIIYFLNERFYIGRKGEELKDDEKSQIIALRIKVVEDNKNIQPYKDILSIAEKLTEDIKTNPRLRYRIMYGTDWPMSEMKVKGVTNYAACMFVILQLVTKNLGGKWDAWHQFAVINPLRFLGLIKKFDEGDNEEYLYLKDDKLEIYKEHLNNKLNKNKKNNDKDPDIISENKSNYSSDNNDEFQKILDKLKDNYHVIPTAHSEKMKRNGKLKILGVEKT